MTTQRFYRVTLQLHESEAVALACLAHSEHRDMQRQAHHIVYRQLVALGFLSDIPLEPPNPPEGTVSTRRP